MGWASISDVYFQPTIMTWLVCNMDESEEDAEICNANYSQYTHTNAHTTNATYIHGVSSIMAQSIHFQTSIINTYIRSNYNKWQSPVTCCLIYAETIFSTQAKLHLKFRIELASVPDYIVAAKK